MRGNVWIGSTVTGRLRSSSLVRVMHIRRGRPLISAEHDPHLPALQFQRTAKSFACVAWMRCTTSSTTMPDSTSVVKSLKPPPEASPRQILNVAVAILTPDSSLLRLLLDHLFQLIGHRLDRHFLHLRASVGPFHDAKIPLRPVATFLRIIIAEMRAAALFARD